ncbi:hypothetical protein [Streptomyces sp. NPDC015350]|uniref:hypothetical protein n=1 Tax=Streptomyces sp. NPDC015350 TaxID=3364955 RepID=UPI0036FFA5B0
MTKKRILLIAGAVLLTAARNRIVTDLRRGDRQPTAPTDRKALASLLLGAGAEIAVPLGIAAARRRNARLARHPHHLNQPSATTPHATADAPF